MKIFLFFVASLFVTKTLVETAAVGRCQLDADNACKDYSTASSCRTINYCKVEIWNKPTTETKTCSMCMQDIKILQNLVKADSTKKFVEHSLVALCGKLAPNAKNECDMLVKKNFYQIYQDVIENLNAQTVCRALRICNPDDIQNTVSDLDLERLVSESLAMPGPVLMNEECDHDNRCKDYKSAKKCNALKECKSSTWLLPIKDDEECQLCKKEVGKLQDLVKQQVTKQEIKEEVLKFCDKIPISVLQEECHKLVVDDFDLIYDDLVAALDPDILCTALHLCNAVSVEDMATASCKLDGNNACFDYYMAVKCDAVDYCKSNVWNKPIQKSELCDICLHDVGLLQKFFDTNLTKEVIQAELLALCKAIPIPTYSNRCQVSVIKNFERIYNDLVNALDPKTFCRAISFCQSVGEEEMFSETLLKKVESQCVDPCLDFVTAKKCGVTSTCIAMVWSGPVKDDEICKFCEDEVSKIQDWLKKATTKAEIEKELTDFCKKIPLSVFSDECSRLVTEDFDAIYDIIIDGLDPSGVCTAMKLCQQKSVGKHVKEIMEKLPGILQKAVDAKRIPMAAPLAADKRVFLVEKAHTLPSLVKSEEDPCSDCEAFVRDFQKTAMSNKKIVNDWTMMLKKECDALGEGIGTLDPKAVCQKIMMCEAVSQKRVGDMCTDCKTFFTEWQNMLKANSSIADEVVHGLSEFICLQKPEQERRQCVRYVSMVIKVLLKKMENEDVGKICYRLEFCSEKSPPKAPDLRQFAQKVSKIIIEALPTHEPQVAGDYCADCHNFIGDLQGVIKNNQSIVQELVDLVKQECDQLGELSEVCVLLVNDHYKDILDQFSKLDVDTICTTIMMCGEKVKRVGGDLCTDCTAFFSDWQAIITNNQSIVDHVKAVAKKAICDLVPFILKGECESTFDKIAAELVSGIEKNDAETICDTLYFCEDKSIEEAENKNEIVKVDGNDCTDCHNFISDLQSVITNNQSTVQELVSLVKQECYQLGELSAVCEELVSQYGDLIIQTFSKLDVSTICSTIMMCGQGQKRVGGDICTDCTAFFMDWQSIIANNQSVIDHLLISGKKAVCDLVPVYQTECQNVFDRVASELIATIERTDAGTICSTLYFCSDNSPLKIENKNSETKIHEDLECKECRFAIEEIEKLIEGNKTEAAIASALVEVCNFYGEDIREECKSFMQQYSPQIIDFLIAEMNALQICQEIGLCEKSVRQKLKTSKIEQRVAGDVECEFCELLFTEVDKLLCDNATQTEILNEIGKVCRYLGKEEDECNTIVHEYGPEILALIAQELSPADICTEIKLCAKKSMVKKTKSDLECEVCTLLVQELDKLLMENSTTAEIEEALDKVCSFLPSDFEKTCDGLVKQYGPEIVQLLIEEMKPSVICVQLELCSNLNKAKKIAFPMECTLCEEVVTYIDKRIDYNSTEKEIIDALDEVCDTIRSAKCRQFVEKYGTYLVKLIVELGTNPRVICTALGACSFAEAAEPPYVIEDKLTSEIDCEVCQLVAEGLDSLLMENSTQTEIEAALEKVCSVLPEDVKTECDDLVKQHGSEIIQLLVEEMNPSKICVMIELCSSEFKQLPKQDLCEVCKMIAKTLEDLLDEKTTQDAIEDALMKVCSFLPAEFKASCDDIITSNYPRFMELLIKEMNPDILCPDLKLCPKTLERVSSELTCELCRVVATELDSLLKENSTEEEIEAALKEVCTILLESIREDCSTLINEYGGTIIQLVVEGIAPAKICPELGLCPKPNKEKITKKKEVNSDTYCEVCKLVAQELDKVLMENSTEHEIEKALMEVCTLLPTQYQEDCDTLVKEFGHAIVDLIVKEMEPEHICPDIGLCPKKKTVVKVSSELTCELCQAVAIGIDSLLEENSTMEEIEAAVAEVCTILPESIKEDCSNLIKEYGSTIIDLLVEEITPAKICPELGLCPKPSKQEMTKNKMDGFVKCEICKIVMNELEKILDKQSTDEEIFDAVNKVCDFVPENYRSTCREYIRDYGPGVIAILIDDFVPGKVCKTLKLCQTSSVESAPLKLHVGSDETCIICKEIIHELDVILGNNITKSAIEIALESLCDKVPDELSSECKTLVEEYAPIIFEYAEKVLNPSFICQKMKLCPTDVQKHILGVDPCTYGPTYWCRDLDAAKRCNAVEHCMNHMWEEK